jgi:hypothetical protein
VTAAVYSSSSGFDYRASAVPPTPGDLNGDGAVDDSDVNVMVDVLLGLITDPVIVGKCDLNGDGSSDGLDVQSLISILIGAP